MSDLTSYVQRRLRELAEPERAPAMAAYMKTEMPFYGVRSAGRKQIERELKQRFVPESRAAHEAGVWELWALPHREEKYVAISYARLWRERIEAASLPLYEQLIREGAWWDLVDEVAVNLVGVALRAEPEVVWPVLDAWIDDPHLWIRRTALIAQLKHRDRTDTERLFAWCLRRADETDFFIRKAIGWALRQYSYTDPEAVRAFLIAHRDDLSGLSVREGAKQLARTGRWPPTG